MNKKRLSNDCIHCNLRHLDLSGVIMDKLTFYRENILIAEVEFSKDPDELVFVNMYKPLTLEENKTIIEELKKRGFNFSKGEKQ